MNYQLIDVEPGVALAVRFVCHGDKPVLMFGNSLASDMSMWREVQELLGDSVSAITYDMRGHGASVSNSRKTDIDVLGQDALRILDYLEIEKVVYVGLSLGGLTGMWLAANHPSRVGGLILANTAWSFPPPSMWLERAAVARRDGLDTLIDATLNRWLTPRFQSDSVKRASEIAKMIGSTPPEGYAQCCEALAGADLRKNLCDITCPVEVIAGIHDSSTPPEKLREILEIIGRGGWQEVNAAHLTAVEAPEAFVIAVSKLLPDICL